jgi:acetyl-CoA acetyltransferase
MSRPARPVASVLGIGSTPFYRRSGRSVVALAAQAALLALADAGLRVADVDAVVPVGGSVSCDDLVSVLGVPETVFDALPAPGGNSGVSALAVADALLASGRAEVALVVFARNGRSENRIASRVTDLPGQQFRTFLERPHGWASGTR